MRCDPCAPICTSIFIVIILTRFQSALLFRYFPLAIDHHRFITTGPSSGNHYEEGHATHACLHTFQSSNPSNGTSMNKKNRALLVYNLCFAIRPFYIVVVSGSFEEISNQINCEGQLLAHFQFHAGIIPTPYICIIWCFRCFSRRIGRIMQNPGALCGFFLHASNDGGVECQVSVPKIAT